MAKCLFGGARVVLVTISPCASLSTLSEENPPTGEPDAEKPPVRFGGRGSRNQSVLPTPIPEAPDLVVLENPAQSSLRDWRIETLPFPALKRRAKLKSRSAARELNSILDPRSSILDPRSSILDPRSSILDLRSPYSSEDTFMPGDYSRKTFNRKKHYRGVLMQQGRVQLDADWNEQLAIQLYRDETEARDLIGLCGAPKSGDAFKITTSGGDLLITPGRIYVGGLLCELEMGAQATYANQPYYPNPELTAQTKKADDPKGPCLLPPKAGYLRLENQLYRVEVHSGGDRGEATFKWSRDNATVETTVNTVSGSLLTVSEVGKDETLAFRDGDWVELVTEESTLKREPFPLAQIDHVDPATREIKLKTAVPAKANAPRLKLRRWDQTGADATADGVKMALANMIDLEGGVQVGFSAGSYRSGDYWLIPARTVTGEIEWPPFEIPNANPQA